MSDFETEPVRGLPELLPPGEVLLWQGTPHWGALAIRAFQARKVAIWFALIFLWRFIASLMSGAAVDTAAQAAFPVLLMSIVPVGFLASMGWLASYVSVYTITSRRIVMRIGVVFSINVNIPFASISSADVKTFRRGNGDIWLTLIGGSRTSYVALWPHVRPWHFSPVQPMLRGIPNVVQVAEILSKALQVTVLESGEEPAATPAEQGPASIAGASQ